MGVIAVGVADSMHVLVEYQNKLRDHEDKFDDLRTHHADSPPSCSRGGTGLRVP